MTDFSFTDQGTIVLLRANTDEGKEHAEEVFADAQTWAGQIVCDHRMAMPVAEALLHDGFTVAWDGDEIELRENAA